MLNVFPKQGKNINYSLPITLQKKNMFVLISI